MKPNPKKLSFSTLALLFAAQVALALFAGALFGGLLDMNVLAAAGIIFILSHLFRTPEGSLCALTITDTTYAGEFYDIFLMKLLAGFESAQKGLVKIQPGIKKQKTIGTLSVDGFIQAAQDPPKFGGTSAVGSRVIVPQDVMGYMEQDPSKFEQHWLAVQMNPELLDRALPPTFESAVVDRTMQVTANWLERIFWRGSYDSVAIATAKTAGLNPGDNNMIFFDGIVKTAKAALATTNKITTTSGTPAVVLTSGNIAQKFNDLKTLILSSADGPAAYNNPNFKWVCNYKTGTIFGDAVKAQNTKGDDFTGRGNRMYDGRPIVEVYGLLDDTILGGVFTSDDQSQLWLGSNAADDWTKMQVAKLQNNSSLIFIKMLMKLGTQVAIPEQLFLYTTSLL